eukprot:scaffold103629_cov19-Tisochrysis_lutea.AAC.2
MEGSRREALDTILNLSTVVLLTEVVHVASAPWKGGQQSLRTAGGAARWGVGSSRVLAGHLRLVSRFLGVETWTWMVAALCNCADKPSVRRNAHEEQ